MLLAAVILSFVVGIVVALLAQYVFTRRWLMYQPSLQSPYKQQHENFQLPQSLLKNLESHTHSRARDHGMKGETGKPTIAERREDQCLVLNMVMQFLFAELKDTARVRRWAARKMNVEFEEMLATTTGKFLNQIQVRDFNFGANFPVVKSLELRGVNLDKEDHIETVDVDVDIDYDGGFQITLDVDLIFGAWAYLSITVTKLAGHCRLQMTRLPFTHWSFAFYDEPKMDFEVDSRFNGRPIPQISSLVINQIKRTIRKKHILPSYKMRFKPLFVKAEESFINPDICFRGNRFGRGKLTVQVLRCSRLQELAPDSKLYCTLSVDKEDMEAVWRQSWSVLDIIIKLSPGVSHGLILRDQTPGEKSYNNKKRVVVESVLPDSPASIADIQKGDIVDHINNVRVLSVKHAFKEIRNGGEILSLRVRRHIDRFLPEELPFEGPPINLEADEKGPITDGIDDQEDFVNICLRESKSFSVNDTSQKNISESHKNNDKSNRKKAQALLMSGKKKLLGGKDTNGEKETRAVPVPRRKSTTSEEDIKVVSESAPSPAAILKDRSQSAKSSPQKQAIDPRRQRAHSDTSLNKKVDVDNNTPPGEATQLSDRRTAETKTREVVFSREPEWNEEFEFDCADEDQYVNICVWCRVAQSGERSSKQLAPGSRTDSQPRNTPPTDSLLQYEVQTKIGFVSIPLADIVAGCLLTGQGDAQYTVYLQSPEETITASRTKVPLSGHPGFDRNICQGDITLSFTHIPFKKLEKQEKREIISEILKPQSEVSRIPTPVKDPEDGKHNFIPRQLPSGTYCNFCGKKIWLKGALQCNVCRMMCHKKCAEKCQAQTWCTTEGPRVAGRVTEPWAAPVRGGEDKEEREGGKLAGGAGLFRKFKSKEQPSLPLNIPNKPTSGRISPSPSPSRSPVRSPSPFAVMSEMSDGSLTVGGMHRNHSSTSIGGSDRILDDDSDEEIMARSRHQTQYNLDVVIEAKEKGKELFADLCLPERKKTLDDMITKLQDTIDKESEYKSELTRSIQETGDQDAKRSISQQMEKCDEKMDALMMMMVHYCAGLQHCLDQEEAHRRMQSMEQLVDPTIREDSGIQFVVTDPSNTEQDLMDG